MANNQIVNFNRQDVANAYRRNQYAQALQERMNAPIPVNTYQGFQAPISPLTGIAKALDIYSVWQNEKNQEDRYQAEKAAAEQKVLDENSRLEQGRENFVSNLNQPIYSETPMPDARSSSESGIPLDQPRDDVYTSTPKTPQEKLAFALSQHGSNNPLIANQAKAFVDQAKEDIKAQALIDKALVDRGYVTSDYSKTLADKIEADTTKNTREVDAAKTKFGYDKILEEMKMKGKDEDKNKLPAAAAKSILGNANHINKVNDAISLMKGEIVGDSQGDANATGFWKGLLPNVALQYFDEGGVPTRAAVSDIGSMVIHDRAGTAATASETPRLKPFIPLVNDYPSVVKEKLTNFKRVYESMEREAHKFYKGQGYNMGGVDEPKEAPTTNRTKTRIFNRATGKIQ